MTTGRSFAICAAASLLWVACQNDPDLGVSGEQLILVPELRVGEEGRGPEYQFTTIYQIVAHNDAVHVVQQGVPEIRVFGPDGSYRQRIGRAGSGPGEFQSSPAIGFLADTLWALDSDVRRIAFFTPEGSQLSTVQLPPIPLTLGHNRQVYFPYPKVLVPGGWILGHGGEAGSSVVSGAVTERPLLRFARSGGASDTLGWVSIAHSNMVIRTERRASLRVQPFGDSPLTAYAPHSGRVVIVERYSASDDTVSTVRVIALEINGDTAWTTDISYRPAPLERAVVDSLLNILRRTYEPRYPHSAIEAALFAPKFRTPVIAVVVGDDGTVWIHWDESTARNRLTVIDAAGHRREAFAPAKVRLKWVSSTSAWGEELDDNDVPTLVRYRIDVKE